MNAKELIVFLVDTPDFETDTKDNVIINIDGKEAKLICAYFRGDNKLVLEAKV